MNLLLRHPRSGANHVVVAEFDDVPAGRHTLQLWRLDDNAVLEAIRRVSVDGDADRD